MNCLGARTQGITALYLRTKRAWLRELQRRFPHKCASVRRDVGGDGKTEFRLSAHSAFNISSETGASSRPLRWWCFVVWISVPLGTGSGSNSFHTGHLERQTTCASPEGTAKSLGQIQSWCKRDLYPGKASKPMPSRGHSNTWLGGDVQAGKELWSSRDEG